MSHKPLWPFVCNYDSEQADGLLGWWPTVSGKQLRDMCGQPHHGTLNGFSFAPGSGWAAGFQGGRSLFYDGTNDFVDFGDIGDNRNQMTFAMWFCPTSNVANYIAAKWTYATQGTWGIGRQSSSGDVVVYIASTLTDAGSNYGITATGVLPVAWTHLCMVYDGTQAANLDRVKLYVNGRFRSFASSGGTFVTTLTNSTAGVQLGQLNGLTPDFQGCIDESRMYGRALSARQVWNLYEPQTRWQLRYQLGRIRVVQIAAAAPTGGQAPRSLHQYRLRRLG